MPRETIGKARKSDEIDWDGWSAGSDADKRPVQSKRRKTFDSPGVEIKRETESDLWKWLRPALVQPPGCAATRIENSAGVGQGDIHAVAFGRSAWIELKRVNGDKIKFRETQPPWIRTRLNAGDRVKVCVLDQDRDAIWVVPGEVVKFVDEKNTVTRAQMETAGGLNWPKVFCYRQTIVDVLFDRAPLMKMHSDRKKAA